MPPKTTKTPVEAAQEKLEIYRKSLADAMVKVRQIL
jgi:hypothetical protein